ncbi:hypothetical protein SOVF_211300, partial [Spinacia oleracea]
MVFQPRNKYNLSFTMSSQISTTLITLRLSVTQSEPKPQYFSDCQFPSYDKEQIDE